MFNVHLNGFLDSLGLDVLQEGRISFLHIDFWGCATHYDYGHAHTICLREQGEISHSVLCGYITTKKWGLARFADKCEQVSA